MEQNTFKIGMAITLLAAMISSGRMAHANDTSPQAEVMQQSPAPRETMQQTTSQFETGIIGGSVSRSAFTLAVVNREPKERVTTLTNDQHHIYYFTELKGMTGQTVTHRWLHNGQTMAELKFNVGAPRWRVWSSKTLLSQWLGEWTVEVIDELGQVVFRESFEYVEAGAASTQ
jgi:hypothetical protein